MPRREEEEAVAAGGMSSRHAAQTVATRLPPTTRDRRGAARLAPLEKNCVALLVLVFDEAGTRALARMAAPAEAAALVQASISLSLFCLCVSTEQVGTTCVRREVDARSSNQSAVLVTSVSRCR